MSCRGYRMPFQNYYKAFHLVNMRLSIIFRFFGIVLLFNALFMLISLGVSIWYDVDDGAFALLYSFLITSLFGLMPLIFVPNTNEISIKEGLFIVAGSWVMSCLIGVLPYVMWGGEISFADAWFESVSGYTTTGATILKDIEALPRSILFWRASTHWIGGIGIVIFVMVMLPSMGNAKSILFRSELAPLAKDNLKYRAREAMRILLWVYLGLTFLEVILLMIFGLDWFDAITHSFATVATGGFSTRNASVAAFNNLPAEIIIMVFMMLSGMHFGLLFAVIVRRRVSLILLSVPLYYIIANLVASGLMAYDLLGSHFDNYWVALRYSSFQLLSAGTSTGFATYDTLGWPWFSLMVLLFFTLQCSCAGSTSGGIKVDRIVIAWKALRTSVRRASHPHAIIPIKIDGHVVAEDTVSGVFMFIVLYLSIVFFSAVALTAMGVPALDAISGSAATMGNVGPGFGGISSMSNYDSIPLAGKWILSGNMLLGRLEIYGLVTLFSRHFWR